MSLQSNWVFSFFSYIIIHLLLFFLSSDQIILFSFPFHIDTIQSPHSVVQWQTRSTHYIYMCMKMNTLYIHTTNFYGYYMEMKTEKFAVCFEFLINRLRFFFVCVSTWKTYWSMNIRQVILSHPKIHIKYFCLKCLRLNKS